MQKLGILLFLFAFPILTHASCGVIKPVAISTSTVAYATNVDRCKNHVNGLAYNPILEKVAQEKAQDMEERGYFSHLSPEGEYVWDRMVASGYGYRYAGENLAWGFTNSKKLNRTWMNSPTHKANILKPQYTEMGVGIAGEYVVVLFGQPYN